jgi:alpha-mannosidase
MYLKQANHRCQNALEKYAEPLSAFAHAAGTPYPYDQLLYAWKLLMQNHPHDSICGCSIDQVHREMLPRFDQVEQVAEELTERALDALTGRDRTRGAVADATRLVVFNTLNWTRTDPVITTLEFPLGELRRGNPPRDDARALKGFRLLDPDGSEVPFAVTKMENVVRGVLNPRELPMDQWVQRITIEFVAKDVPACGYAAYTLVPHATMPRFPLAAEAANHDEDHYPLFFLNDGADVGDEYLYRPPLQDEFHRIEYLDGSCREQKSAVRTTRTIHDAQWMLPVSVAADGQGRSAEHLPCRVVARITQWVNVCRWEVQVQFDNCVRDHRLRLHFVNSELSRVENSIAEGQFDVIERPLHHPLEADGALPFHPQQSWVAITAKGAGNVIRGGVRTTAVINRGLPEYEVKQRSHRNGCPGDLELQVTLLRCVAQLSGRGDGPGILTPDAQCLGENTFDLAYTVTEGDWKQGRVWQQAHQFNVPLRAVQAPADESRPARHSYATVEPAELVVTAIKRAEDSQSVIVRFFNITDEPVAEGRVTLAGAARARLVNLNEEPQGEWTDGDTLSLPVGAKQIVTVEFALAE